MIYSKQKQAGRYSRKKRQVADNTPEKTIQQAVEYILKLNHIKYIHIPEDLQRYLKLYAPMNIKKIASNALKGIPDIIAFMGDKCLLLELKSGKGRLTQGQREWHRGCNVHVTHGMDEALNVVNKWIKINMMLSSNVL